MRNFFLHEIQKPSMTSTTINFEENLKQHVMLLCKKQGYMLTCSSCRDPHVHATAHVDRAVASSSAKRAVYA